MRYRRLGKSGYKVSEVGFGTWAIGGEWGDTDDTAAMEALHTAADAGVTFFDTSDVYGDGHAERLLGKFRAERDEEIVVATKAGRRGSNEPHTYDLAHLEEWVARSQENLGTERLDLVQLHCPPTDVYYMPEVFGVLDDLMQQGKIKHYGISVERVEEALKAIEYPNVKTVQIIFNMFRQRPAALFFHEAQARNVGILARVPLASGLLTGKMSRQTTFPEDDHRNYNREGEAFDRGETFAGVEFERGLAAVDKLEALKPEGISMPQFALRWILMFVAVTCAIPGAKRPGQVKENASAADLPPLAPETMAAIREIYDEMIREQVHHRW